MYFLRQNPHGSGHLLKNRIMINIKLKFPGNGMLLHDETIVSSQGNSS